MIFTNAYLIPKLVEENDMNFPWMENGCLPNDPETKLVYCKLLQVLITFLQQF